MDPFSAATGVAGLISLGIELGKGLKNYYEDFQSMDDDIMLHNQHAERLGTFVEMLNSRIEGRDQVDPELSTSLQECYEACNVCLQDFGNLSKKYSQNPGTKTKGVRERWEAALAHFHYPLQKKRFEALKAQAENFRSQISERLQLLNYVGTVDLRGRMTAETEKVLSAVQLLPQIQQAIDQLPEVLLAQFIQAFKSDMALAVESPQTPCEAAKEPVLLDFNLGNQQAASQNGKHFSLIPRHGRVEKISKEDPLISAWTNFETSRAISPSCTTIMPASFNKGQTRLSRFEVSGFRSFSCTCKSIRPRHRVNSQRSNGHNHKDDCPVSFLNRRNRALAIGQASIKTLFQWLALVTPYKLDYSLTARAIVSEDSPAFMVINKLDSIEFGQIQNEKQLESRLLGILTSLKQLFREQKAWPTDTLYTDLNILHIACSLLDDNWSEPMAHIFCQFIEALVNMGVPINGNGYFGTPLRWLLQHSHHRQLTFPHLLNCFDSIESLPYVAKSLIGLGKFYSENPNDWAYEPPSLSSVRIFPSIYRSLSNSLEAFEYGKLSCALFRKSETSVRQILSVSLDPIFERGHHDQTPLHVSAYWPHGLRLLFELAEEACKAIIDDVDKTGLTPIRCAIAWQQAESVELLLKNHATVDLEDTDNFFVNDAHFPMGLQTTRVCETLAEELAKRRRAMRDYAFDRLFDDDVERFQLRHKTMLQGDAFDVIECLESQGVSVPREYKLVKPGSIYHGPSMTDTLAEALFQSGFNEVDFMKYGYTPLTILPCQDVADTIRLIVWLDEHQASLYATIPQPRAGDGTTGLSTNGRDFKAIHRLAYLIGSLVGETAFLSLPIPSFPRRIFSNSPRDPCQCYCATNGCNPASLFTKGWLSSRGFRAMGERLPPGSDDGLSPGNLLSILFEEDQDVLYDVFRLMTFERLGMHHTCCRYNHRNSWLHRLHLSDYASGAFHPISVMDPSEVIEIHGDDDEDGKGGEDRYLAKTLNRLMEGFLSALKLKAFGHFPDFLEFWLNQMDEFDRKTTIASRENMDAILDLGVRLERVCEIERDRQTSSAAVSKVVMS